MTEDTSASVDNPRQILAITTTGVAVIMTGRLVLSPLLPEVIEELQITSGEAGLSVSVMWGFLALSRYPGAHVSDQLSRKTVLVASIAIAVIGALLLMTAPAYLPFLVGAGAFGIGVGLYTPTAIVLLSEIFGDRRGQTLGVFEASLNLGGVMASGLAVAVVAVASWRSAFVPISLVLCIILVMTHYLNDEPYVLSTISLDPFRTVRRILGDGQLRWIIASFSIFAFIWQSIASFLPTYLQAAKRFSPELAGGAFAGLFVIGIIANPIAGRIGDFFGYRVVSILTTVLATIGFAIVLIGTQVPIILAGIVILAVGLTAFWPVMTAHVLTFFPAERRGGDFGALSAVYFTLGSLGPTYVGFTAERADYPLAFTGLLLCFLLSVLVTVGVGLRT